MCFEPFLHQVIMPRGDAGLCCTFEDKDCANVLGTPLKDVWTGPFMSKVRADILARTPPNFCRQCLLARIELNRRMQKDFGQYSEIEMESPRESVEKTLSSLKNYGLAGSARRGREWVQIKLKRILAKHSA